MNYFTIKNALRNAFIYSNLNGKRGQSLSNRKGLIRAERYFLETGVSIVKSDVLTFVYDNKLGKGDIRFDTPFQIKMSEDTLINLHKHLCTYGTQMQELISSVVSALDHLTPEIYNGLRAMEPDEFQDKLWSYIRAMFKAERIGHSLTRLSVSERRKEFSKWIKLFGSHENLSISLIEMFVEIYNSTTYHREVEYTNNKCRTCKYCWHNNDGTYMCRYYQEIPGNIMSGVVGGIYKDLRTTTDGTLVSRYKPYGCVSCKDYKRNK